MRGILSVILLSISVCAARAQADINRIGYYLRNSFIVTDYTKKNFYQKLEIRDDSCEKLQIYFSSIDDSLGHNIFDFRFFSSALSLQVTSSKQKTTKTMIYIYGTGLKNGSKKEIDCFTPISSWQKISGKTQLKLEHVGVYRAFDRAQFIAFLGDVTGTVNSLISIVRPNIGARILSKVLGLNKDGNPVTLSESISEINRRIVAIDTILGKLSNRFGAPKTTSKSLNLGGYNEQNAFFRMFPDGYFVVTKLTRWSILTDANAFPPTITALGLFHELMGVTAEKFAESFDAAYFSGMQSADHNIVRSRCFNLINSFQDSLARHDALAVVWYLAYIARGANSQSQPACFSKQEAKELADYGLTQEPYAGAYAK